MQVAGSVDLDQALFDLALSRPIFHSEADFQLALAWELQRCDPAMRVRLETRPEPGTHLDIDCFRPDLGRSTALEIKYLTRSWSGELNGDRFDLMSHAAQPRRSYDVVKDIARVERFIAGHPERDGAVVVVSNDPNYWRPKSLGRDMTTAAAFRLTDGSVLSGVRDWGANTGPGTKKGKEEPISLHGTYTMRWRDYSTVGRDGGRGATFRLLLVPIANVSE